MTESLRIEERPELRSPVLVAAFRGWNDGGQGASLAAGFLAKTWNAERFADIDPEEFFDFQVSRPKVSLVEGQTRRIDWPETVFYQAAIPGTERDAVLLLGIEPNMHWRTFCDLIVGLARDLGVELAVTLGSLLADVPHTRPAPVTGSATDPELIERYGLASSRYEGPTGIRAARVAPRHRNRHLGARVGCRDLQRAGDRSRLERPGDDGVRRAARAAKRRARHGDRPAVGRDARGRAHAVPPRARRGGSRRRGRRALGAVATRT